MPDLGPYATSVLSAYSVSFVLLGGMILRILTRAVKARKALARMESPRDG